MYKLVVSAFICAAIFLTFIPEFTYAAKTIEIALEAELANTIQAPLVVAVPKDAEAKGGIEPDEPSRGKFIWAPGAPTTGGGGSGFAEFIVDIPRADTYAIWGHVIAWDGNSDSFWVTVLPADPADENPQTSGNTQYRWGVAQGNIWHWDRINHWLDGGTFDREWDLPVGEAIIKIWTREDATMLDALFITSDNKPTDPASANVRLPTDEDVEIQISGLSVHPMDKLSTTWGRIKEK
ncbi:TPA: hypothetical protein EYP66_16425 [Candidatus Poribacteria bacterium]|nr:hypothetical protein [Candidatus Poribacteria bacterium]